MTLYEYIMPTEIASESEILENVKRNILEEKRSYLCKYLNPDDHFDFLRSKFIITREDQEIIQGERTRSAKAGKLLDILLTKGPEAYQMLVMSIQQNRTQTFLVVMLNKEFENRKNSYIALLKNKTTSIEADLMVDTNLLPKPNTMERKCVESIDRSVTPELDKDFDDMCIRESYMECPNKHYNGLFENAGGSTPDQICQRHQSDA